MGEDKLSVSLYEEDWDLILDALCIYRSACSTLEQDDNYNECLGIINDICVETKKDPKYFGVDLFEKTDDADGTDECNDIKECIIWNVIHKAKDLREIPLNKPILISFGKGKVLESFIAETKSRGRIVAQYYDDYDYIDIVAWACLPDGVDCEVD